MKGLPSPISYHPAWTFFPSCGLTAKIIGENLKSSVWGIQSYWIWMQVSEEGRSQDLFYAATGITSAHSLNSPRRLLAGSVFISFHFWKVPLKKILTLKILFFGIRTCVLVKTSFRAPSSPNRFYAYGSFKKGSYEQRAFNGFLYYIHMPNFGLKFCPGRWAPSGNIGVA